MSEGTRGHEQKSASRGHSETEGPFFDCDAYTVGRTVRSQISLLSGPSPWPRCPRALDSTRCEPVFLCGFDTLSSLVYVILCLLKVITVSLWAIFQASYRLTAHAPLSWRFPFGRWKSSCDLMLGNNGNLASPQSVDAPLVSGGDAGKVDSQDAIRSLASAGDRATVHAHRRGEVGQWLAHAGLVTL